MKTLPDILSHPLVGAAYALATKAHEGQFRRDGKTPYLRHIETVMLRTPDDPILQAVAALHDSLEGDCAHPPLTGDIALLHDEVFIGVHVLTRQRAESYKAFIHRVKQTAEGRFVPVKVADNLANLSDSPTEAQIVRYAEALLALLS